MEKGFNGGQPITEEWFTDKLSGGHNPEAIAMLFPGINDADNAAIADDKEARFRALAGACDIACCGCRHSLQRVLLSRFVFGPENLHLQSTEVHGLDPNPGLPEFLAWADAKGLKMAAVTNAPRCTMQMVTCVRIALSNCSTKPAQPNDSGQIRSGAQCAG